MKSKKEIKIPIETYEKLRKVFNSEEIVALFELAKEYDFTQNLQPQPLLITEDGIEIFDKHQKLYWLDWSLGKNGFQLPSISEYSLACCPIKKEKYKPFLSKENAIQYHKNHLAHFSWEDIVEAYKEAAPLDSPLYNKLIHALKKRI